MTWYTLFLWLHILGAVVWVGGGVVLQVLALRIVGVRDGSRQVEFAKDAEFVGTRIFTPASLLVLLAGIAMMVNASLPWGANWVVFGLIVFGLSFAIGAGFLGPESGRLARLIDADGPDSPAVTARLRRILAVSRAELVLLVGVIWNMAVKPVGQPGWFWGALAVVGAGVAAVLVMYLRGAGGAATPAASTE